MYIFIIIMLVLAASDGALTYILCQDKRYREGNAIWSGVMKKIGLSGMLIISRLFSISCVLIIAFLSPRVSGIVPAIAMIICIVINVFAVCNNLYLYIDSRVSR